MALATPRLRSGAAAKATRPQRSPSALPAAAPAPRGELGYGSLISRTAAASCVFLYFSFLPAAFFDAPPPMKGIVRRKALQICPAQRKKFCSRGRARRFVKAFCGIVKCSAACLGLRLGLGPRARSRARARVRVGVRVRDPLGGLLVREVAHQRHDPPLSWRGRCTLSLVVSSGRL